MGCTVVSYLKIIFPFKVTLPNIKVSLGYIQCWDFANRFRKAKKITSGLSELSLIRLCKSRKDALCKPMTSEMCRCFCGFDS